MKRSEFGDITMLKVSDLRCIDVFEAEVGIEGNLIPIIGPNGAGKSTIIDAISILFEGGKLPSDLIRHGKKEAFIEAMSNNGVIVRKRIRTRADGEQVAELVLTKENQPIASPQSALKELFGKLASPNAIAAAKGSDLYNQLITNAGVDLSSHESMIEKFKEKAREGRAKIKVLGYKENPGERPDNAKPFDINRYNALRDEMQQYDDLVNEVDELVERMEKGKEVIEKMELQLAEAKERLSKITVKHETCKTTLSSYSLEKMVAEKAELDEAYLQQDKVKVFDEYTAWKEQIDDAQFEVDEAERLILVEREASRKAIESADLGVPGLKATADGKVLYKGNAWENTCFSDRMKAAAILTMKGMDKEQLNLMYMEHGESLSKMKRQELAEQCKANGVHLIMEVFVENPDESQEEGYVLKAVSDEPYIPEQDKPEAPVEKIKPAPFGKPIPAEILKGNTAKANPFDSVDNDIFGGNNEGIDF